MSQCLSPHLANIGNASRPVTTIHLHSDGSWWCWSPGGIEQGPFATRQLAEEAWQSVVERIQKQPPGPPVSNAPFWKTVLIELSFAALFVFVSWLIDHRR